MGVKAEKDLQNYDAEKVTALLTMQEKNLATDQRIRNNLDIHSALLFECGTNISKKVAGLKTDDGHTLIQKKPDHFIAWDSGEQQEKRLEKIVTAIDPDSKLQICSTYDIDNKDLVIHFGGTDFANSYDLAAATTSLTGALNPRTADGAKYAEMSVDKLAERFPDKSLDDVNISIVAHSSGAAPVAPAIVALAEKRLQG